MPVPCICSQIFYWFCCVCLPLGLFPLVQLANLVSIVLRICLEAIRRSTTETISRLLRNPKVHCRVRKSQPPSPRPPFHTVVSWTVINPFHIRKPDLLKTFYYYLSIYICLSQMFSFLRGRWLNFCTRFSSFHCVSHVPSTWIPIELIMRRM